LGISPPQEVVREGLSEIRTTVLGPQILLGFQYQSLFQPGFARLEPWRQSASLAALGLLLATVMLVLAPAPFHQIAEAGQRTARQAAFTDRALAASLGPFALAVGLNLLVVGASEWGAGAAAIVGALAAGLCLLLWYGIEAMVRRPASRPERDLRTAKTSLKDQVADLMTETRIVLPGVQALLGFQFAAYLTDAFPKLSPGVRAAHHAGLALLLLSMVLLMTPAPFHRLAEEGQDSTRTCRVGRACIVGALGTLALGLAADIYVAIRIITGSGPAAVGGAGLGAFAAFGLWFALPLVRRASHPGSAQVPSESSKQS
jgi:hypothetical protein